MFRAKLIERDQEDKSNWAQELEYTIRKEGADVYYQFRPDPDRVFVEQLEDGPRRLLTHNRMIIDLLANIKGHAGERFAPESVIVPDKLRFKVNISYTFPSGKTETYDKHIYPDGAFAIAYPDKPRNYVLEMENTSVKSRTTLYTSSYFRKLLCYKYVYEKELYKELGWDNMRVLVGAPTMELLMGKMKLQAELIGPKTVFLYQVIPLNGKLGDMFTTPWYRVGHPPITLDTNEAINTP
jgi:hypothetical protein